MGWQLVRADATARISSHNSEQDRIDDALWEEFCNRIEQISREHRYESLDIQLTLTSR